MTKDEVVAIIQKLSGVYQLLIKLFYGTGLHLSKGLKLRVQDAEIIRYNPQVLYKQRQSHALATSQMRLTAVSHSYSDRPQQFCVFYD